MNTESHTATSSSTTGQSGRGLFLGWLRSVFPRIVAMIYTGGTVAHILRLIFRPDMTKLPFWIDWVLVIVGPIGVIGLVVYSKQVQYRGRWEHITHWLIVFHLFGSVVFHASWCRLISTAQNCRPEDCLRGFPLSLIVDASHVVKRRACARSVKVLVYPRLGVSP